MSRSLGMRPAVFLDRDGVLCEERGCLSNGDALRLFPFAAAAVRAIHEAGFLAIVATNQSAVARGLLSEEELRGMNQDLAARTGVDAVYYCPHLEGAKVPEYDLRCNCRKPRTGMVAQACEDFGVDRGRSWFVGDRASDVQTGINAGLRTALLESGYGTARLEADVRPDHIFADLIAFAEFLREGA